MMTCGKDTNEVCACKNDSSHDEVTALPSLTTAPVQLPGRKDVIDRSNKPPIWAITNAQNGDVPPIPAKCDRHTDHREGVCCKELKGDDERTLIDPDVVRDIVIGLSDGLTVPFALTAGLSSIGNSRIVVMGGLAELIAGAISMGVGGFLASQSERDHFRYMRNQTRERVQRSCAGEMEREVHAVLGPVGVDKKLSVQVADCLRKVDDGVLVAGGDLTEKGKFVKGRSGLEAGDDALRWSEDVGLTAFLLKFGEGMEDIPNRRLYISAFTIGMGYFLGGLVPLLPYFFVHHVYRALMVSCVITGVILLIFGAVKTHVTGATGGWRGYVWGASSMLAVGGGAAAAAYGIVRALEVDTHLG